MLFDVIYYTIFFFEKNTDIFVVYVFFVLILRYIYFIEK